MDSFYRQTACSLVFVLSLLIFGMVSADGLPVPVAATILDVQAISVREGETPVGGLSGLAWDMDDKLLWAVSDRGMVVAYSLRIDQQRISEIKRQRFFPLSGADGPLDNKRWRDAEGLDLLAANNGILGDTQLMVSYERRPRLWLHDLSGTHINTPSLPPLLSSKETYLKPNNALEAVTGHPRYGWLTGAEFPFMPERSNFHTLYTADGSYEWHFRRSPYEQSAMTGLQYLHDDLVVVLERAYVSPYQPFFIVIRLLRLDHCDEQRVCQADTLLVMNSHLHGPLDNFEGLAKLDNNHLLLISDDNESQSQNTLLMLLQLQYDE